MPYPAWPAEALSLRNSPPALPSLACGGPLPRNSPPFSPGGSTLPSYPAPPTPPLLRVRRPPVLPATSAGPWHWSLGGRTRRGGRGPGRGGGGTPRCAAGGAGAGRGGASSRRALAKMWLARCVGGQGANAGLRGGARCLTCQVGGSCMTCSASCRACVACGGGTSMTYTTVYVRLTLAHALLTLRVAN